jgi:hypothetical protein
MLAKERLLSCGYYSTAISRIKEIKEQIDEFKGREKPLNSYHNEIKCFERTCNELLRDFNREVAKFPEAIEYNKRVKKSPPVRYKHSGWKMDNIQEQYEEIVYLIGYRCYEKAKSKIIKLLETLQINNFFGKEDYDVNIKLKSVKHRQIARDWIENRTPPPKILQFVIRILRRLMFLEMLIAQKHQLLDEIDKSNSKEHSSKRISFLRHAEIVYVLATELMRNIDDPDFLQTENAYIRTHYGVLLGNLKRFKEAHRRLNEAYGYLTQSSKKNKSTPWAVIYLRRAEVYLQQAQYYQTPNTDKKIERKVQGYLNDAYCALEQAERHLKGYRKNIWWWTWMYELKVKVCVLLARIHSQCCHRDQIIRGQHEPLVCSRCTSEGQRCFELLQESMELIQYDPLRQAKLTFLFSEFLSSLELNDKKMCIQLLNEALNHLKLLLKNRNKSSHSLDPGLCQYVNAVIMGIEKEVSDLEANKKRKPKIVEIPASGKRKERSRSESLYSTRKS